MIYFSAVLFVIYNIMLFLYAKSLYAVSKSILLSLFLVTPLNFFIIYASIYITEFSNDYIIMLVYFIVYSLEFKIIFKQTYLKIFFGSISFALNFFAMRTIILSIIALVNQIPISEAILDIDTRLLSTTITLFLRPFTLRRAMQSVNKDQIFLIFSNKDNLRFSLQILFITFAYQIATSFLIDVPTTSLNTTAFLLGVGLFCFGTYIVTMVHAHEFSKLKLYSEDFSRLKNEVKKEAEELEVLKNEAEIDFFTGMYIRRVAEEKLNDYVSSEQQFYIVYFDMDGLKTANDVYGHDEGDFYIRKTSKIILSIFENEFVSRLGGDEFLVLGKHGDEYDIAKKVLVCYEDIKKISAKYNKPYNTSISYGIVEVDKKNTHTPKELLSIADQKMYEFKKERKKAR